IALLPSSPALDADAACISADGVTPVATDARGVSRPQGTGCEMGAFEATATSSLLTISKNLASALTLGQQGSYTLTVSNAAIAMPTSGTVSVLDILPVGMGLVSMSGTGWFCTPVPTAFPRSGAACTRSDVLNP